MQFFEKVRKLIQFYWWQRKDIENFIKLDLTKSQESHKPIFLLFYIKFFFNKLLFSVICVICQTLFIQFQKYHLLKTQTSFSNSKLVEVY